LKKIWIRLQSGRWSTTPLDWMVFKKDIANICENEHLSFNPARPFSTSIGALNGQMKREDHPGMVHAYNEYGITEYTFVMVYKYQAPKTLDLTVKLDDTY